MISCVSLTFSPAGSTRAKRQRYILFPAEPRESTNDSLSVVIVHCSTIVHVHIAIICATSLFGSYIFTFQFHLRLLNAAPNSEIENMIPLVKKLRRRRRRNTLIIIFRFKN